MLEGNLQMMTGLSLDKLAENLKNSAGGVAVYAAPKAPGNPYASPVAILGFFKVATKSDAENVLAKFMQAMPGAQKQTLGAGNTFYQFGPPRDPMAAALIGDYVVLGNAVQQITALAKGEKGSGWSPQTGGAQLLAMEVFAGDIKKEFAAFAPPAAKAMLDKSIKDDSYYSMTLALSGKGLALVAKGKGLGSGAGGLAPVAAIAIPSLLRSRTAANQTSAMAACKAYAEAQEIYRRTDYDSDGVLEYAQSIKGNHSLLEQTAGAGDLALVDRTFGDAEGEPSQAKPKAGYLFKILKAQGADATGGRRSYFTEHPVRPGSKGGSPSMTLGYALIAYPAVYGSTGRDCFIINNNGVIFQADLGPDTHRLVRQMTEFNPTPGVWVPSE